MGHLDTFAGHRRFTARRLENKTSVSARFSKQAQFVCCVQFVSGLSVLLWKSSEGIAEQSINISKNVHITETARKGNEMCRSKLT